jgi:uncharacterized repeat protein (TIGR03803 family)
VLQDAGGTLDGTTSGGGAAGNGTVFEITPKTGAERVLYNFTGGQDGQYPDDLTNIGTTLYGATAASWAARTGTLFKLQP